MVTIYVEFRVFCSITIHDLQFFVPKKMHPVKNLLVTGFCLPHNVRKQASPHRCICCIFCSAIPANPGIAHKFHNARSNHLERLHPSKKNTNRHRRILNTCILQEALLMQLLHSRRKVHISLPALALTARDSVQYFEACRSIASLRRLH